jgi:pimeloyl-ACP methyl ester carboxylesterase
LADTPENKAGRYQQAESILANGVKEVAEGMPGKLTARPGLQAWLKELILRQRPEGLVGALRAMAERPDSTQLLGGFDLPFVLVHGLADALIPIERARSVKAAVPGAHLAEIPGAGHMPMMEDPQKTAEALKVLR